MWGPIIKIVATGVVATVAGKLAKDQLSKIKTAPPAPAQPGNRPITVVAVEPTPRRSFFRVRTQQITPTLPPKKKTSYLGWIGVGLFGVLALGGAVAIKGTAGGLLKSAVAKVGSILIGKAVTSATGKVATGVATAGAACLAFSQLAVPNSKDGEGTKARFSALGVECTKERAKK